MHGLLNLNKPVDQIDCRLITLPLISNEYSLHVHLDYKPQCIQLHVQHMLQLCCIHPAHVNIDACRLPCC